MRYGLLENFTSFLLLFLIRHDFPKAIDSVYTASLNNSDEIKNIFSHVDVIKNATDSELKGTHRNENYMEGGVIDIKDVVPPAYIPVKKVDQNLLNNTRNVLKSSGVMERQNIHSFQMNASDSKNKDNLNLSTYKNLQDTKLPGPGSNLFLGVPEVIHINGTSSIKARKGVNFNNIDNKIVPHKGVDNENKESFLTNYLCFWLNDKDCYNAEETQDFECRCCKKGNALGEIFKLKALVNCNKCKPMTNANKMSAEDKVICTNICCKSVFHDINLISTTQDNFVKLRNNSKLKPTVTKVPYDVEVMTELLSKAKQKVFLPVVVSLLLLPLIGVSVFFIWQKTKEYWDKRFYKRMDFLIDGMYND